VERCGAVWGPAVCAVGGRWQRSKGAAAARRERGWEGGLAAAQGKEEALNTKKYGQRKISFIEPNLTSKSLTNSRRRVYPPSAEAPDLNDLCLPNYSNPVGLYNTTG
jgi:hypothetical protein